MAAITHAKISGKSDGPDATLVRPSDWNADHIITGLVNAPQGRLTLATAIPVMTSTVSGATTIYYTPYVGNLVPIYDGTNVVPTTFTELSVATTDATKSPAAIGASKVNDWFVWNDAGTLRLGHGPDWTNDTTRSAGTVLNYIFGIWTNSVAITNGPATNRGTYVGTTRSNGSSQLNWIYGSVAAGGGMATFGVWNAYNRVDVSTLVLESTDSWSVAQGPSAANSSTTFRVNYISGLQEDTFAAQFILSASPSITADYAIASIGYDSATVPVGISSFGPGGTGAVGTSTSIYSTSSLGYHFMQACEQLNTAAANNAVGFGQSVGVTGGASLTGLFWQGRM